MSTNDELLALLDRLHKSDAKWQIAADAAAAIRDCAKTCETEFLKFCDEGHRELSPAAIFCSVAILSRYGLTEGSGS